MRIGGLRRTDGCVDEWLHVSVLQSPHKAAGVGGSGAERRRTAGGFAGPWEAGLDGGWREAGGWGSLEAQCLNQATRRPRG